MKKFEKRLCAPEVHLEKNVCRDHLVCYARFEEFLKNCLQSRSGGKKLASAQSMVEKTFLSPRNHDTTPPPPPLRENNGPSLTPDSLFIGFWWNFVWWLFHMTNLNIYIFGTIECNKRHSDVTMLGFQLLKCKIYVIISVLGWFPIYNRKPHPLTEFECNLAKIIESRALCSFLDSGMQNNLE